MDKPSVLEKYVTKKDCLTSKEDLLYMNQVLELSGVDIAALIGVEKTTVRNAFVRHGIKLKRTGKKTKGTHRIKDETISSKLADKSLLFGMHHTQKMTIQEMALDLGVQRKTLISRLTALSIPICRHNTNIVDKRNDTMLSTYGVKNAGHVPELIEKKEKTMLLKYGVKNFGNTNISDASRLLLEDKEWLMDQHLTQQKSALQISDELEVSGNTPLNYMKQHGIDIKRFNSSGPEHELADFIETLGVVVIRNTKKVINPLELDIFLPDYNIALEFNGLYWHSELHKPDDYHLSKTVKCESVGVRLVHIFEDEWRDQKQKCKDTIKHLLHKSEKGIYARHCTVRQVQWKVAKSFLDQYHLLDAGTCGHYRIGAFDPNDNLIGIMVFGHQSNERSDVTAVELKRFVTNKKNNPGLGSKMFKYAVTEQQYSSVIAFVDRRWFSGLVKDHIGFKKEYTTPPTIWWTNGTIRKHRRFITKKQLIADGASEQDTKKSILKDKGFYIIRDCGKIKLKWNAND